MTKIKAIETEYNGYKFRSRLEARWAVFFDSMGIKYKYELEGFEMESGERYLPDFYLPDSDTYVEVKPHDPSRFHELKKVIHFVTEDPSKVVLVLTDIPNTTSDCIVWHPVIAYSPVDRVPIVRMVFFEGHDVKTNTHLSRDSVRPIGYYYREGGDVPDDPLTERGYIEDSDMPAGKKIEIYYSDITESLSDTFERLAMLANGDFSETHYYEGMGSIRKVQEAYKKARAARFEFGQTPGGDS